VVAAAAASFAGARVRRVACSKNTAQNMALAWCTT
jgi:hypothetical protein